MRLYTVTAMRLYTVTAMRMTPSCIQTGSDESHFNGSLIVRGKSHKGSVHRMQLSKSEESR